MLLLGWEVGVYGFQNSLPIGEFKTKSRNLKHIEEKRQVDQMISYPNQGRSKTKEPQCGEATRPFLWPSGWHCVTGVALLKQLSH